MPSSLKEFNISNYEEVEMAVDLLPAIRCVNSTGDATAQLSVQWEYLVRNEKICTEFRMIAINMSGDNMSNESNVTDNFSNDSNSSNISGGG